MICIEIMQESPRKIKDFLSNVMDGEIKRLVVAPAEKMKAIQDYDRKIENLDNSIVPIKNLHWPTKLNFPLFLVEFQGPSTPLTFH